MAFGVSAVAGQLVKAGGAPDIGGHVKLVAQNIGRRLHLLQDGAATEQLHSQPLFRLAFGNVIQPFDNAFDDFRAFRQSRLMVVFIHGGDVVPDILTVTIHPLQAVLDDNGHFVAVGRIVTDAVRHRSGQHMAVAILMLQTFTVQRGAPGSSTDQKAAPLDIACGPGQVARALEAEHGVEGVKRNHRHVVVTVRRSRGDPGGVSTRFVNARLKNLPLA